MRVLVVHNRYRLEGGEERSVELQIDALQRAGIAHALLERSSAEVSRPRAALALLRGGRDEDDVDAAARELGADVVHVHNMLPTFGSRALRAARATGAYFDPPEDDKGYVHRVGRTGRAGRSGSGITLVLPDQQDDVSRVAARLGHREQFEREGMTVARPRRVYTSRRGRNSRW